MKVDKFYDPYAKKCETVIVIQRKDIEQSLSWYKRLTSEQKTVKDVQVYDDLCKVVDHMKSLNKE